MSSMTLIENIIFFFITAGACGIVKIIYDNRSSILRWLTKQKIIILPAKFTVALSIESREGLNSGNYYEEIKRELRNKIHDAGLAKEVYVCDFSDILKFNSADEASAFLNRKSIDLLIWGRFSNDALKQNGVYLNKIHLNFTFNIPRFKDNNLHEVIIGDISSKLALKNYWQIFEDNSAQDLEVVSRNFFDISTYIVALTLKFRGKIEKGLLIFDGLLADLKRRNDPMANSVVPHIIHCCSILVFEHGVARQEYQKGIDLCKKILAFDINNAFALKNMASFQYRIGDIDSAKKAVSRLCKLAPNSQITIVDAAFFDILEKKYSNAAQRYSKLINTSKNENFEFNILDLIEFLSDEYDRSKEPAFLFACGVLSMHYGDSKLARKYLNRFTRLTTETVYGVMHINACQYLKS